MELLNNKLPELSKNFPKNASIRTADIRDMYNCINPREAAHSIRRLFQIIGIENARNESHFNLVFGVISWVFRSSYVCFKDRVYQQITGLPMGNPMSPILANLYVVTLERYTIDIINDIYLPNSLSFVRYLDDVLFFTYHDKVTSSMEESYFEPPEETFVLAMNEYELHKLEYILSPSASRLNESVNYLDLKIQWVRSDDVPNSKKLKFSIFDKPINKHIYTDPSTFYPPNYVYGWIQGENIRYIRNNDDEQTYNYMLKEFINFLRRRAYPEKIIQQKISLNNYNDRDDLLKGGKPHQMRKLIGSGNTNGETSKNANWLFVPLENDSARPIVSDSLKGATKLSSLISKDETCTFLFPVRRGRSIYSTLAKALKL
jgi:hypothetical protein